MSYLFVNNQEIKNDSGNPIPITGTVTNTGGDIAVSNFPSTQTVDGTVALDASSLAALENTTVDINNFPSVQTVDGTMFLDSTNITALQSVTATISNFPATQTVDGTVALDATSLAALETITVDTIANPIIVDVINNPVAVTGTFFQATQPISGTVSVNQPVAITDNDSSITVDGAISVNNFPSTQTVDGIITPYFVGIAQGLVSGTSSINKFGYREVPAHASNYYPLYSRYAAADTTDYYDFPTAASIASVTSSSGSDSGAVVRVSGLDANYAEAEEDITIGGSAGVQQFIRVHRASLISTTHASGANVGNITVEVNSKDVAYLPAGYGQTLQTIYTVPANKTAYLFQIDVGVDEKEKPVHARIRARDNTITNAAWQTKVFIVMESNYISHNQTVPIKITEKSDIILEANSSAGAIEVSGGFDLVLVNN